MSELDSHKPRDSFGKLTMKQPYSKKRIFSYHVRGYIDLLRPFTLLAPIIVSMSIIVASLVFNARFYGLEIPTNWWVTVGNASLTIALVNAASNALNQSTDFEADKISKPYRPIPKGVINPEEALENAYQSLQETLASDIIQSIKECSPQFFERLVIDVLVKMGYGATFV